MCLTPNSPEWLVWPIPLALMASLCFFAWAMREEAIVRERVQEFVLALSADAVVLVDGEHFIGDRAETLLGSLAEMTPEPGNHSHPEESFLVRLIVGEKRMELEVCRDSKRRREYWVYLLNEGTYRTMNAVGGIETDLLDDLVPIRPSKSERNRPRVGNPR